MNTYLLNILSIIIPPLSLIKLSTEKLLALFFPFPTFLGVHCEPIKTNVSKMSQVEPDKTFLALLFAGSAEIYWPKSIYFWASAIGLQKNIQKIGAVSSEY